MNEKEYCKCGHEKEAHALIKGTRECYTFIKKGECRYRCICRKYDGLDGEIK